jgi:hypothetical protein
MKYFPELFEYYDNVLESVCVLSEDCNFPYRDLPFASFTLNVGKKCICNVHVDSSNLSTGLCLVIPLGNFDPGKGGHLILHELRLFLELPPGSIVLFPSAIITHENVSISEGETRQAFTAFTPALMFQWSANGFNRVPEMSKQERIDYGTFHWNRGKSLFPHIRRFF